jgi:hypothetical protein
MKKQLLIIFGLLSVFGFSQDHFSGINTSRRVGIINVGINPSELSNLNSKFEIQLISTSVNVANNKVGFSDITGGKNLEDLLFKTAGDVNLNVDAQILGPGVAVKLLGFGFAVTSKAYVKSNIIDFNPNLGNAFINGATNAATGTPSIISSNKNQRISTTAWGEVALSAGTKIFDTDKSKLSVGVSLKLLFPGAYSNTGLSSFNGTITSDNLGNVYLSNTNANLNIAYTANMDKNFSDVNDYTSSLFGNLNGMATDIGVDYQIKGSGDAYKFKFGAALVNIGSMTFKSEDNSSKNYKLKIEGTDKLKINELANADGAKDIEKFLNDSHYLRLIDSEKSFKVKLPTVLNLYANMKLFPMLGLSLYTQQRLNKSSANDQIASQNFVSIIPRLNLKVFETYIPISINEISGTTAGIGFRIGGFFIGSNSILTALTSDSKQADIYTGFRFGFL